MNDDEAIAAWRSDLPSGSQISGAANGGLQVWHQGESAILRFITADGRYLSAEYWVNEAELRRRLLG